MDHAEHCTLLVAEIDRFATAVETIDPSTPIPTCPEWKASELIQHVGAVHRWAEEIVRAGKLIGPQRDVDHPSDSPSLAAWIREGGAALLATLRVADPTAPIWAWGADQHVRWWSRRQLYETLVHRVDLQLASNEEPTIEPHIATDAIDEFLINLSCAELFSPSVRELRGSGETISFRTTDTGHTWTATLEADGFAITSKASTVDASYIGPAANLLLLLYRRIAPSNVTIELTGDHALLRFWIQQARLG